MQGTQNEAWDGFVGGDWQRQIDVRDFIQRNYTPYDGDESFLAEATGATNALWSEVMGLFQEEREHGGVLDIASTPGVGSEFSARFPAQRLNAQADTEDAVPSGAKAANS